MLRPGDAQSEDHDHTMGRAGDAPAARMLGSTAHEKRQDLTSARQARPLLSLRL